MPDCPDSLIVSTNAEELAEEVARLAPVPMAIKACTSAKQALVDYTDESVVFGAPDLIAEILPEMSTVEWVQSTWAGVTPLIALDRRDYILTGVKAVFGPQMSEYVIAHLLAHELKVVRRMDEQREHNWFDAGSGVLQGKRLGIMGTGSIGQHIAKMAEYFGIIVTGLSRSGAPAPGFNDVMPIGQLDDFLQEIDYLVAVLPQTAGTDKLLNAASLAKLPAHAYIINVGRSNVVDDDALISALKNDRLAGATLDVFDEEPLPQDSPLWDVPKLSITAHVAAASHPSLIVPIFIENYRRYTNKQALKYVINFDAGY
ncbi:MAG: D-2-hydroxyacid dehydrogenase [Proteobacteria bacterium]|nr:D-2-hydroxyacid dehydrogenase [Pseudomonadota bacterium]